MSECIKCSVDNDNEYIRDGMCLECYSFHASNTIAALEQKLKSSEDIRIAEKKILIAEIEKNASLREEVERLKAMNQVVKEIQEINKLNNTTIAALREEVETLNNELAESKIADYLIQINDLRAEIKDKNRIIDVIVEAYSGIKPEERYVFAAKVYALREEAERLNAELDGVEGLKHGMIESAHSKQKKK